MAGINKIRVSLLIEGQELEVGELVRSAQKIYFRYQADFLKTGLNISPIKLPLNEEIHTAGQVPFDGLFGVFNDALPDGWGRLLLDRSLSAQGINMAEIGPLDRLAYVGTNGMGALIYRPEFETVQDLLPLIELDLIANETRQILQGSPSDMMEELLLLGGSSGGARPKILIGYNPEIEELIYGAAILPAGFQDWIIKFSSSVDHPEIARIEFAYYKMALTAGIEMSECKLIQGKSGQVYFATKRFDRYNNKRLHVHTAAGLMHDNFRVSTMDYGHLMDCANKLENHVEAYEKIFRLAAFNVFAHNRDDHSKNFSFLMNAEGQWQFAPAYDLTFAYSSYGFHSTMIAGESQHPGKKHLMKLAHHFGLKNGASIIEEVQDAIAQWEVIAADCRVSQNSIKKVKSHIETVRTNP